MCRLYLAACGLIFVLPLLADEPARNSLLLKPARVFDGVTPEANEGWVVLVRGLRMNRRSASRV